MHEKSKDSSKLTALANRTNPRGYTNVEDTLSVVLEKYEEELVLNQRRRLKNPSVGFARPLTIYILTDGVWRRGGNPEVPVFSLLEVLAT